jgi:uncharacterized protein
MNDAAADAPVTVVVQTRTREGQGEAFAKWQAGMSATVAAQPGFIEQSVMPPNPPTQIDWVILQRFKSADTAVAWLHSGTRQKFIAQVQPMLVGVDDVHLLRDPAAGAAPAPVSAVFTTRVKPGQEEAFRAWEQRVAAAQARAPGFQGFRFEPPVPGVQDDWMAILRFDTEAHLQGWMDSPERKALLSESEPLVQEYHTRIVRSGFEQWFPGADGAAALPVWKQNMIVLLVLYPVVFLFGRYIGTPILMGWAGIPFYAALFISNVASIVVMNWLVPWTSQALGWWLKPPKESNGRVDLAGAALMFFFYGVLLLAFYAIS